jgi:isoleucyl-tRNA synthetase
VTNLQFLVRQEMEKYRLYTVVPKLLAFLENLTNWYVRLNRLRFKGETTPEDWKVALNVLFEVIHKANVLMAPYAPFMTEMMYDNMKLCMKD